MPYFSFIIPVYNRPSEVEDLLKSIQELDYNEDYEVVIIEDGSQQTSKEVVKKFSNLLPISYYYKENSGPGDSRNYGMQQAKGDYFLILDSDVILPQNYLLEVQKALKKEPVDCFGGVDNAHQSFSDLQKAINFVMTSFLTTGGIRGGGEQLGKFQPRSFNMGISKQAFFATNGFGKIHPGEDPDLSLRLWKQGFKTALFPLVEVYHKRRISWKKFRIQVEKFGKCRPILSYWHPKSSKLTYWFPTVFTLTFIASIFLLILGVNWPFLVFVVYIFALFILAFFKYNSLKIAAMSVYAMFIQFFGYGKGFLESTIKIKWLKGAPEEVFPNLFFKK